MAVIILLTIALGIVPGIIAVKLLMIVVRGYLKGEIKAPIGRGASLRYKAYYAGTFSFWLQIVGYLLFVFLFSGLSFALLLGAFVASGHAPAWLHR